MVISGRVIDSEEKFTQSGKREVGVRVKDDSAGIVKVKSYGDKAVVPEPGEMVEYSVWAVNTWVNERGVAYVSFMGGLLEPGSPEV